MASMVIIHCFLVSFCILCQVVHSMFNLERSNISEAGSFCSRKCEKLSEQPVEEDTPLYHCSCSPSCSVYGDCCFDSPYNNTTVHRHLDFVCLSVVGHDRYRAVSGCPSNVAADFCKDGLGHLPPVTSRKTNVTYANVFCAECNSDKEDLIKWNVDLRCSPEINSSAKYIYQSGKIWSLDESARTKALCKFYVHYNDSSFMEGIELKSCTAYVRKRSRCSPSWTNTSVSEMCKSYEDPVYFNNAVYRNAHCALCNYLKLEYADCIPARVKNVLQKGEIDAKVNQFCKTRGSDACIQALADKWKGGQYSFADLLNIHEKSCVPPRGRRCCKGEAFDFRSQRCRKIRN